MFISIEKFPKSRELFPSFCEAEDDFSPILWYTYYMEIERIRQLCSGGNIKWSAHAKREFLCFLPQSGKNASIASKQKVGKQGRALRY